MKREEWWDWPPTRRRRSYRTIDYHQPTGWSSPITRKIVRVYWRTMVITVKMLVSIPLAMMAVGAFWLFWAIVTLTLFKA